MAAEVVVQEIMVVGAVRTVRLATCPKPSTGDRDDACSISAVGDHGVSSGECRNDDYHVSGAVCETIFACLFVIRS